MSGICGIVHFDGALVERRQLEDMTEFMSFRGPDAQEVWLDGAAGFGHTLLRTTFESEHERQPLSLDGKVWITADARIDARLELARELAGRDRAPAATATDAELILHAYHAWGEECVRHLIGDFAFAIWDARRERLFCARDHLGVKPFFYAQVGQCLIFSNTLNCVRRHPGVPDTLNDLAIADFLLFEMNQDAGTTAFGGIRRLPPGQTLTGSRNGLRQASYWALPTDGEVRYRPAGEYVERFRELLEAAVADRLRIDRVGVEMSGGLDSPAIAATALGLLERQSRPFELRAHTIVYDRLIPDEERRYSAIVARRLGIPIHYCVADEYRLYERCDQPETHYPEPIHYPNVALGVDMAKQIGAHGRVLFTGLDGDALLNESPKPYFRALLKQRRFARMLVGMARYGVSQRRLIPLAWRGWRRAGGEPRPYPAWMNPDLEKRLGLRDRWEEVNRAPAASHPIRPYAFGIFSYIGRLSNYFEYYDSGVTKAPLEYRHPLMDLRLLDYCLRLPPMPWCVKKEILRAAMQGVLPEPVRTRPKTPLAGSPHLELLRRPDARWIDHFVAAPGLGEYVDRARIPRVCGEADRDRTWANLRPLSLNFWLQGLQPASR